MPHDPSLILSGVTLLIRDVLKGCMNKKYGNFCMILVMLTLPTYVKDYPNEQN